MAKFIETTAPGIYINTYSELTVNTVGIYTYFNIRIDLH